MKERKVRNENSASKRRHHKISGEVPVELDRDETNMPRERILPLTDEETAPWKNLCLSLMYHQFRDLCDRRRHLAHIRCSRTWQLN